MLGLVVETEALAAQLRVAPNAVTSARITCSFTWHQSAPMRYVNSPFGWIERVSLYDLLNDFGRNR